MPNGTEEDTDEAPGTGHGGDGPAEEPSQPPEGLADEGTTVGAWDLDTPSGYWRVSGILLALVALAGFVVNAVGGNYAYVPNVEAMENILVFDWAHNLLHTVLAAIALALLIPLGSVGYLLVREARALFASLTSARLTELLDAAAAFTQT
jgi:hypothetical protein